MTTKEIEKNRQYAEKLTALMQEHPDYSVQVLIDSEGITDDYSYWVGNMYEPVLEQVIVGHDEVWHTKTDEDYDDCLNYYGYEADDWSDEELEEKAKAIPWETVIALKVSAA